jgi:hypothetical protein
MGSAETDAAPPSLNTLAGYGEAASLLSAVFEVSGGGGPSPARGAKHAAIRYSMTSSARASTFAGTSRPSVLAVLRLITRSYFTGACTGRSPGFSPLKMRST